MDFVSYLNDVTQHIRANGGDLIASVRLDIDQTAHHPNAVTYTAVDVEVELLIPFTFAGKSMSCVTTGEYSEQVRWVCYNDVQREHNQGAALVSALEDAITFAEADIYAQLMGARPTARAKRLQRKTRAVLKQLYNSK